MYEALQFERTIQLGQQLLKDHPTFTPQELIHIHQYLGFSYFNLGKEDSARIHFLTILQIDPDYQFDPVTTSPKIISYFEKLKGQMKQSGQAEKPSAIRYIFIKDKRPEASLKSCLLPGWGQYSKGQKKKATIFFTAFFTTTVFTATSAFLEKHFHQKYKSVEDVRQLNKAYQNYNRWYKARRYGTLLAVTIWATSVFDAMWAKYEWNSTQWSITGDGNVYHFSVAINF